MNFKVFEENHEVVGKNIYSLIRCNHCYQIVKKRKSNLKTTSHCGCLRGASGKTKPGADKSAFKAYHGGYIHGAKRRGLSWELSIEDFTNLINKDCEYCGDTPREWPKLYNQMKSRSTKYKSREFDEEYYKHAKIKVNGIDRVNNEEGYTPHNCVPCCKTCNYFKHQLTVEQMMEHVKKLYLNQKLGEP